MLNQTEFSVIPSQARGAGAAVLGTDSSSAGLLVERSEPAEGAQAHGRPPRREGRQEGHHNPAEGRPGRQGTERGNGARVCSSRTVRTIRASAARFRRSRVRLSDGS